MPSFELDGYTPAPVEEVWKLLYDPVRFPRWWAGVERVQPGPDGNFTLWPTGYPDSPMPQRLQTTAADSRVTISCLVSDLEYRWQLREHGTGTGIQVHVQLPDSEAHRLPTQRDLLRTSLTNLAQLAATQAGLPPPTG